MEEAQEPLIMKYLSAMNAYGASDLYLTIGYPPTIKIEGNMKKLRKNDLDHEEINEIISSILTYRQKRDFEAEQEMNTALDMGKFGRFRVSVLQQRQKPAIVIRRIVSKIPSMSELKLPSLLASLAMEKRGLVLITGVTGSGKTTTLASMIDFRNFNEEGHIITIEDPIEYYHEHKKCIITQREVGVDTQSFSVALKNALRQRPDVITIGEVRDREVMEQALAASETGHLCLATIHSSNANQAIERAINLFPEERHSQVRLSLSLNLRAIISQRLLPGKSGNLIPAMEIMLNQGLIREHILKGRIGELKDVMAQNNSIGMCTFDQSLFRLFKEGLISQEVAVANADQGGDLKIRIEQDKIGTTERSFGSVDVSKISLAD